MHKKVVVIIGVFIFLICSCKHSSKRKLVDNLFELSLGIKDELSQHSNIDSVRKIINALDSSNDSVALLWLNKNYKTEADEYNAYVGIVPRVEENLKISIYLTYRYNEYIGDIEKDRLYFNLLGSNHIYHFKKDSNDSTINELKEIEENYLSFYLDSTHKYKYFDLIKSKLEKYPTSKRLKYLYANMNLEINKINVCLPIYNELLQSDYYSYKILRRLAGYYQHINFDSCKIYLNILEKRFNYRCVTESLDTKNDSLFILGCNNCLKGNSKRDSIKSRVALTGYYLKQNDFKKISNLYEQFSKLNKEFVLDSLKIWEAGEYYDIMLQSFFLQQQYAKFCTFLFKEVSYNLKVKVENSSEFYNLVKGYYFKYNKDKSIDDFDVFFNKNFFPYSKGKLPSFT